MNTYIVWHDDKKNAQEIKAISNHEAAQRYALGKPATEVYVRQEGQMELTAYKTDGRYGVWRIS